MTLQKFIARVTRGIGIQSKGGGGVTRKSIEDSLKEQLKLQNKTSDFYHDLVSDYLSYWVIKKKLIADIKKNGIRYKTKNGNGFEIEKPNESVTNLTKITTAMLKIINDLNLKEPLSDDSDEDDY